MFEKNGASISSMLKNAKKQKETPAFEPEYVEEISEDVEEIIQAAPRVKAKPKKTVDRRIATPIPENRKVYPERTFDKYSQKMTRLSDESIDVLKHFCSEISRAKKSIPRENRSVSRITDNNVIRLLVEKFCENVEKDLDTLNFSHIQTDSELKNYIDQVMSF